MQQLLILNEIISFTIYTVKILATFLLCYSSPVCPQANTTTIAHFIRAYRYITYNLQITNKLAFSFR